MYLALIYPQIPVKTLISTGFSVEKAQETVSKFEEYIQTHRDEEKAIRLIAENTGDPITYAMLEDLKKKFLAANSQFSIDNLWHSYNVLNQNTVIPLRDKSEKEVLTNLIQLVRFSLKMIPELRSLASLAAQRFELWCGQNQRDTLSVTQREIARKITNYVVSNGSCSRESFFSTEPSFLREAKNAFGSMDKVDFIL